ncbi:mycothiol synthase [Paramicrobacterium humi]|uniref:Mycothiol acetyltransferase n=1 Tax=Paramicrobacterium humi TaxID=640635 RepID=A0A1H4NQH2_9MICO|nr:mycothiol synthase [Microbacterium humi]SEB97195.1 mycothiol synthase [Microbacterium humi]
MLRAHDLRDEAVSGRFAALVDAAAGADGQPPFSDQSIVDARNGRSDYLEVTDAAGGVVGAAIDSAADPAEFELVIHPAHRGRGHGTAALQELLGRHDGEVLTWAHGDHPAAAKLAASAGLDRVRTLLQLRTPLGQATGERDSFDRFDAARDGDDWVRLNAEVFRTHPEQGRLTRADLDARLAEPWFRSRDFLLARDEDDALIGYNWLKVEGGIGEIYVIGVAESAAGAGLGRRLMHAGLEQLREDGCDTAALYVDDENAPAVALYRSLGFTDHTIDVQYRRAAP